MSFIEVPIADAKEKESVPEGGYDTVISKADPHTSEASGKSSIRCIIDIDGVENAAGVFHYISIPDAEDDDEKRNNKLVMMKKFLEIYSVPFEGNGFNTDDLLGARAKVYLGTDLGDDGIVRNKVTFKKI